METPGRLYPLIIFCAGTMIFIFLFFFRLISVSEDEIRSLGLFSSKDFSPIKSGQTLCLTLRKGGKIRVELFGKSDAPGFSWMRGDYKESEVNLYREKAVGKEGALLPLLKSFGISKTEASQLFTEDAAYDLEKYKIESKTENGEKSIRILIK
jgi:hypothetical protein